MNKNYPMEWVNQIQHTQPAGLCGAPTVGQVNLTAPIHQKSKMATPCGQAGGFIDLKERSGIAPGVSKNSVQLSVNVKTIVQPSEDGPASFAALDQKKILSELLARSRQCQPVSPTTVLPAPTLGSSEKFSVAKKVAEVQQTQPSKTFIEGPPLPLFDKSEEFGVELRKDGSKTFDLGPELHKPQLASKYSQGEIKYTTKGALNQMVQDLSRLKHGVTGCIIEETCDPLLNMYTEGIHFVADECLGKGSYGTVDLCYDSKTKKRFVRKQLPKTLLRTSEIIVPTTLNHHNVTKFYGLIQRENEGEGNPNMELLMEYAGFSLNKYILGEKRFTPEQIWDLAKQGLEALAHISRYSIVHLDVKPENICVIMMRGSLTLKLTDFGSSKLPHEPLKFVGLTPEYMAPEICKMFLQTQNPELNWGLTEDDITGKVDLFAFALVLMYLYKGYHILVKVINKGNTTYDGVDMQTRRLLHIQLMTLLADDSSGSSFVQSLIPDECDLEMRQLLRKLTEHQHQDRFSAREGLAFIEVKQKNTRIAVRQETKVKDATQQHVEKQIPVMAIDTGCEMDIPGIAEDCMESDNGPVKNRTKDALRMKLQPYGKSGKKGKNSKNLSSKTISARASVSEMHELCQGIASKQMPMTPVLEFRDLSLGQAVPGNAFQTDNRSTTVHQRKTDRNGPVAQPSMDTTPTYAQAAPAFGFSGLNPTQQVPGISCVNPFMRVEPENNIVSLGGNGIRPVATPVMNVPNNGAKVMRLEIPQELIQRWLQKKAEQAQVKTESTVHPGVINISDQIPQLARREQVKVEQAESLKKMEEDDVGNLPNFAQFF